MRTVIVWMEKIFLRKIKYKIYWEILPLNHYRGTIKIVGQYKSRVLSQELQENL